MNIEDFYYWFITYSLYEQGNRVRGRELALHTEARNK